MVFVDIDPIKSRAQFNDLHSTQYTQLGITHLTYNNHATSIIIIIINVCFKRNVFETGHLNDPQAHLQSSNSSALLHLLIGLSFCLSYCLCIKHYVKQLALGVLHPSTNIFKS